MNKKNVYIYYLRYSKKRGLEDKKFANSVMC